MSANESMPLNPPVSGHTDPYLDQAIPEMGQGAGGVLGPSTPSPIDESVSVYNADYMPPAPAPGIPTSDNTISQPAHGIPGGQPVPGHMPGQAMPPAPMPPVSPPVMLPHYAQGQDMGAGPGMSPQAPPVYPAQYSQPAAPDPTAFMPHHEPPVLPQPGAAMGPPHAQQVPGAYPNYGASMHGGQPVNEYATGSAGDNDIVIPRISIEVFFERPAVQSTVAVAAGDRRMSDASVEIIPGGLPAAIARYAHYPLPNVIMVESSLPGPQIIAQLDNLANLCDESVKVMVVGVANDVELYRELMRRGVSEYLVPPLEPLQLIRAIAGLVGDPESPFSGKCVAVCGVKGGVGASTIAHNLAWASAERIQLATTLVDFDLNFGTASLNFNQDKMQSIADALASPDRFDTSVVSRMATKISDRLSLLNAPSMLDSGYEFEPAAYRTIIAEIRKTVPFVFMDMPTNWSEAARAPLVVADEVIVVAAPDLASLRNAKNMVDFFVAKRPNDSPPHIVLNMVGVPGRPEISEKEFVSALGMSPAATIQFEPRLFGAAANSGRMLAAVSPEAKCVRILDSLATALTGRELRRPSGMGGFIGRMLSSPK